jgi:hypothetical protein
MYGAGKLMLLLLPPWTVMEDLKRESLGHGVEETKEGLSRSTIEFWGLFRAGIFE